MAETPLPVTVALAAWNAEGSASALAALCRADTALWTWPYALRVDCTLASWFCSCVRGWDSTIIISETSWLTLSCPAVISGAEAELYEEVALLLLELGNKLASEEPVVEDVVIKNLSLVASMPSCRPAGR